MKKVKFILYNLSYSGGFNRVISVLSKSSLNNFVELKCIVFSRESVEYDVRCEILNLLEPSTNGIVQKFKIFFTRLFKLSYIKMKEPDAIYISNWDGVNIVNILSSLISSISGKKVTSTIIRDDKSHDLRIYYSNSIYRSFIYILMKLLYRYADRLITNNNISKKYFEKKFNIPSEKIKVIYNPINFTEIQALKDENLGEYEVVFSNSRVLITAGRLTKQKGQWYLLRIFRELKKEFKDLKLVILGQGELKDYLVNLSEALGLKTFVWDRDKISEAFDVYFLGFQKNPFKFIAHSELFVFPSLWEGFPNALVEAMACGVPVISSDCRSGPREILAPDTDFMYQTNKPEFAKYGVLMPTFEIEYKTANEPLNKAERLWVKILSEILKNEKLKKEYSLKAYTRAKDFDIDKIIQQWKEVLQ
jgi:glycosyltransferase involved in cell wall biosynthesis